MKDLSANYQALHIVRTGPRGGTPVVLIHAVGMDLTLWGQQIEELQKAYDVVAIDLPGHGLSDKLVGEPSFTKFAAILAQNIESLAAGPVHLVGISFGGMLAQTVAIDWPALVRSLSLIGTACTFPEVTRTALKERARFIRNEGIKALAPLSLARWFTADFSKRRPDVLDRVAKILYQQDAEFHAAMWDMISTVDTQSRLQQHSVPALIIVGKEDASTPVSAAHTLADALGTSRVHLVPNSSHFTNLEAPEIVNGLLLNFFSIV